MKLIVASAQSDLETLRLGNEISRAKRSKYFIMDTKLNRATLRLGWGIITVAEFVSIASNFSYIPLRHCALESAPDRSKLVARRRTAPPPRSQQIDSDSAWYREHLWQSFFLNIAFMTDSSSQIINIDKTLFLWTFKENNPFDFVPWMNSAICRFYCF